MDTCPRCGIRTILIDYRDRLQRFDGKQLPRYVERCPRCDLEASSFVLPPVPEAPPDASPLAAAAPSGESVEQLALFDYLPADFSYVKPVLKGF